VGLSNLHLVVSSDDDASGLMCMCMANTKTNTKQMQGSPREMSYKACIQNAMKANEAYTLQTVHRHSVHSDNMGNSHRALCEHSGTHTDTRHSVGEVGGYPRNTGQ
jgi:hypothetical protein